MENRIRQQYDIIRELASSEAFVSGDMMTLAKHATRLAYPIVQCSRINLWFFNDERTRFHCLFHYGGTHFKRGPTLETKDYPNYFNELDKNRTLEVPRAQYDPRTEELLDSYLIPNDLFSLLDSGIFDGENLIGIYCFEQAGKERLWSTEDIQFARVLSDLFSGAYVLKKRIEAERALRESRASLEESNLTLKNVLSEIEKEKRSQMEAVSLNIERNVKPVIEELRPQLNGESQHLLMQLEHQIEHLSSDFYRRLANYNYNLTPTELKICEMIKAGRQGKEIAQSLHLSFHTIETHKKNIRKKMGLTGKPMNLKRVLEEIEQM